MPFTLAHPVAVLPLVRCRMLHFPALVIGSLSPDFVYFLHGKPVHGGHALWADSLPNVLMTPAVYVLWRNLWQPILRLYLPRSLNAAPPPFAAPDRSAWAAAFLLSAWIGMASHIFLDAFTHAGGWFVQHAALLRQPCGGLPLYKWLQYGGGAGGLAVLTVYRILSARRWRQHSPKTARQKRLFWSGYALLCGAGWILWQTAAPVAPNAYAIHTIRLLDCAAIIMTAIGTIFRCRQIPVQAA